jgi:hypothetical protein
MLAALNPTYSLRVIIKDALPEPMSYQAGQQAGMAAMNSPANGRKWYNGLTGKTGCDDVLSAVRDALNKVGIQAEVSLDKFEHR